MIEGEVGVLEMDALPRERGDPFFRTGFDPRALATPYRWFPTPPPPPRGRRKIPRPRLSAGRPPLAPLPGPGPGAGPEAHPLTRQPATQAHTPGRPA